MRNYLGHFEEMVLLTVAILGDQAYGVAIKDELEQQTEKKASIGALHSALDRLERKRIPSIVDGRSYRIERGKAQALLPSNEFGQGSPQGIEKHAR